MFKKRQNKNFRRKLSDEEDNRGVEIRSDNESRDSSGSNSLKDQKKIEIGNPPKSVPSANSLLSFAEEEEEEVFQIRKSTASRNLEKARRRAAKEEKANSKDAPLLNSASSRKNVIAKEVKIEKEERSPSPIIISGRDAENVQTDDEPEIMGKFKKVLIGGTIPDANLIHMARKQRQLAREMGPTAEVPGNYVPLKKVDDTQKYRKEKSRLVREDDDNENSDSGEEGGRFYSKLRDENEEQRREVEADFLRVEQGDSDEEKDDELDRWEREQIRKGVSKNQIGYFAQEYLASNYDGDPFGRHSTHPKYEEIGTTSMVKEMKEPQPMEIDMDLAEDDDVIELKQETGQRSSALPKIGGSSQATADSAGSLRDVNAKLKQRQSEFQAAHNSRLLEQEKIRGFLTENEDATGKLEESVPKLTAQYRFYQEMRTYVKDLLDCLNEKMPLIEKLETRMMELWSGRSQFLIKRRQRDVKDQYEECYAASSGKLNQLQQDSDRMMHAAEREARRTRRRLAREKTLASLAHHEGMSSDDEEAPSRIVNFTNEKDKLTSEASDVFNDTADEFYSVAEIIQRFMEWRNLYRESFDQAYIVFCIPKLLAPLVRWRMFSWTPLEADSQSLKTSDWYKSLENIERSNRDVSEDEEEFHVLFTTIDAGLLPRLKDIVECVWDPTSTTQTSNLVAFISNLHRDHPESIESGKNLKILKDAIKDRIKRCFDDDLFTPIYSKEVLENKATGASSFLDRQFWFAIKVMQNVSAWSNVFPDSVVQELIFDGVVNRHVNLALQCAGSPDMMTLTKCKAVCTALPTSWFTSVNACGSESLPHAEPFYKKLVYIADEFNANKNLDKNVIRDAIKEIHRLLKQIRGPKYAKIIQDKYRLR